MGRARLGLATSAL